MAAGNSEEPCDSLYKEAIECAVHHLGLEALKQKQCEAIQSYISGNDTFVVLPTGYGKSARKSVIYAALPVIFDKLRGTNTLLQVLMDMYICQLSMLAEAKSVLS